MNIQLELAIITEGELALLETQQEIQNLVESDLAKGDFHSTVLLR